MQLQNLKIGSLAKGIVLAKNKKDKGESELNVLWRVQWGGGVCKIIIMPHMGGGGLKINLKALYYILNSSILQH